jgi:hypothetical protein
MKILEAVEDASLCVNVGTELFFAKSTLLKTNCREHQCNAKTEGT